jgi:hypothetical protein
MADALEAVGKDMHQETSQEFIGVQRHHFPAVLVFIVLVGKSDLSVFQFQQPIVGDRDPMRVATQVIQHFLGTAEWGFGINDPLAFAERRQIPRANLWGSDKCVRSPKKWSFPAA